ncbi:putative GMC oxidoreductase [Hypomontagnella submonticulosa]|nr:putative GMC oxidoreductase [Hypomontagnella submonticulosa]
MWPSSYNPEHSPLEVNGKTYDYIVVGGGTAGCVVASRLSEDPDVSVLVIERGHIKDNIVSRVPLLSQHTGLVNILQIQSNRWTEPMPGANGRRNRLWAVEGMGGSSRINGTVWTRGFPGDYAAWAEMGLDDWGYEKLEPYFRKLENAVALPKSESRGYDGPVKLRQLSFPFEWSAYIEQAAQKLGLSLEKDINHPTAPAMGLFSLDTAIDQTGKRVSAYTAYLSKAVTYQRRNRLTLCTGAAASRLEVDLQTGLVTGVYVKYSNGIPGEFLVKARREVIVCSGAIGTPQLLLLSGIGPTSSSEKFGIPLVRELPAVGATLSDHYSFPIELELPKKETFHFLETIWAIWHMLLWLLFGRGLFSLTPISSSIFVRTGTIDKNTMQVNSHDEDGHSNLDASLSRNVPDIEVMTIATNSVERPIEGCSFMSLYPTLAQPYGSGRVELINTDALSQPRITYPMFTDKRDIEAARLAVRFTMRLASELQHSKYPYPVKLVFAPGQDPSILEEWERTASIEHNVPKPNKRADEGPGSRENKTWKNVTDEEIDDYLRRVSHTSLHLSSTCPMSNDEKSGVVDQELRVYGFGNLRIADTSVFPKVPSCHTMAPAMMVAERCADMVKAAWKGRKSQ